MELRQSFLSPFPYLAIVCGIWHLIDTQIGVEMLGDVLLESISVLETVIIYLCGGQIGKSVITNNMEWGLKVRVRHSANV